MLFVRDLFVLARSKQERQSLAVIKLYQCVFLIYYFQIFGANQNTFAPVTNHLPTPIIASYIRIYPMSWNIAPTMRVELLGDYKSGLIYKGNLFSQYLI